MAYPYDTDTLTAISNLGTYYNGNNYDAGSNPGGMGAGGHRTNFIPSLQDVAVVADSISDAADAAAGYAVDAEDSATLSLASATALNGTSVTSVAIGVGSKSFTSQAGKSFNVGTFVIVVSDANPLVNYMTGQVTAYDSGTGVITINVPSGGTGGSGTYADWTIYGRSGTIGATGAAGATGSNGVTPTLQWTFGASTVDADPGNGVFLLNNASPSLATFLFIDNLDINGATVTTQLDSWDDSTNTGNRGTLRLVKLSDQTKYAEYIVTGSVNDGTGYRKVPVSYVASTGTFTNGDIVCIFFVRTGNAGSDGVGAGDTISDIASVVDGRVVLFNGTTGKHITNASVGIGTSGANLGALNGNNTYSGSANFTSTVAYSSTFVGTSANANALTVGPNGVTNPTLQVDSATVSAATGLKLTAAAAGAGLSLALISSGTNDSLTVNAKGTGNITFNTIATGAIQFSRNAVPTASDGAALGTTALMWSDLFLASGGVINLNNGDVTLTHVNNQLVIAGGDVLVTNSSASSSTSTGALVVTGGLGVGGALYASTITTTTFNASTVAASANASTGTSLAVGTSLTVNTSLSVGTTSAFAGVASFNNSTIASGTNSGCALFAGGLGVAGRSVFGGAVSNSCHIHVGDGQAGVWAIESHSWDAGWLALGQNSSCVIAGFYQGSFSNQVGSIVTSSTTTTFFTTSDERKKTKFDASGINWGERIDALWVGDFEFKADPGTVRLGVRAQQAIAYFPQAVNHDEVQDTWQASMGDFAPLALWGVKDLRKRIDKLEKQLAERVQ